MNIKQLLRLSKQAVCGITEREVVVHKSKKAASIRAIKKAGFIYVGEGVAGRDTVKLWFARTALI